MTCPPVNLASVPGPRDVWDDGRVNYVRCNRRDDGSFETCILFTFRWASTYRTSPPGMAPETFTNWWHENLAGRGVGTTAQEATSKAYGDGLARMEAIGPTFVAPLELSKSFERWDERLGDIA